MEQNNKQEAKRVLETAVKYLARLKELHEVYNYNEFPKQIFEQAEFMLHVIKELGQPSQYEEAAELYKKWHSEVTPLVLLTLNEENQELILKEENRDGESAS